MEEVPKENEEIIQGYRVSNPGSKSNSRKSSLEPVEEADDDIMTSAGLEKKLREQLPDPEKITTASDGREKVSKLNELVITARKDLLRSIHQIAALEKALNVSVGINTTLSEQLKKQQEATKDLALKMLLETKGQLEGAFSMFGQGMKQMTFSMQQWMSDEKTIQELLIPLARAFPESEFSCSDSHVYMPLQPNEDDAISAQTRFLSEYEYGLTLTYDDEYHLEFDPKELGEKITAYTFQNFVFGINNSIPGIHKAMLRWLSKNAEEEADRQRAKTLL